MNPSGEDINLVEDILVVLAKDYVNERDGLSLALSSENFASVYGRNRLTHIRTIHPIIQSYLH